MKVELDSVIITPLSTEKSEFEKKIGERLKKRIIKYTFEVHPAANKRMIKQAIEKVFNVKPDSVNIIVNRGKIRKFRNIPSRNAHWKKAIVTFNNGAELEFGKGA